MGGEEMSEERPETRIVDFPPCDFQNFLQHMADCDGMEWTWSYIEMCSRFGLFHSSDSGVILARPINSKIPESDIAAFNDLDPNHELASLSLTKESDTWHILYASGDPLYFFDLCPYELEFISWHRNKGNNRLKRYKFNKIKDKFHGK